MAASVLHALGRGDEIRARLDQPGAGAVAEMLAKRGPRPPTSSCGRLFDALQRYWAYARSRATRAGSDASGGARGSARPVAALDSGFVLDERCELDLLPIMEHLLDISHPALGAALFHATLSAGLAAWTLGAARRTGLNTVVLGGGCLLNRLLASTLVARLEAEGLRVLEAAQAPPNDGGSVWVRHGRDAGRSLTIDD